ncbi:MAG: Uma2 family endonuclease [Moorella sp. (in: firmicutes)]
MSQQDDHSLLKESCARYAVADARPLPPGKMTFEQFLTWADEDTLTSPESLEREQGIKFKEYEQAGVNEYWLIHPDTRQAEFFQLQDGCYRKIRPGEDGVYCSRVLPGFRLNLNKLWEEVQ